MRRYSERKAVVEAEGQPPLQCALQTLIAAVDNGFRLRMQPHQAERRLTRRGRCLRRPQSLFHQRNRRERKGIRLRLRFQAAYRPRGNENPPAWPLPHRDR